jgi:hypothetical protein
MSASMVLPQMSETGTFETSRHDPVKSAYEVKAVVRRRSPEGRF